MRRALGFLTIVGKAPPPLPSTLLWFPVVGAALGGVVGSSWWAAGRLWSPLIAAVLAVAADLVLTGLLHVDGLADAADGLLAHVARDRRLEIMAKPDVGAYGAAVVATVLLARVAGLAATRASPLLIAGLWCASRSLMAAAVTTMPYARGEAGLAAAFRGGPVPGMTRLAVLPAAVVASVVIAALGSGIQGAVAALAVPIAGAGVLAVSQRRIGGYTGDVLGAAGMVGESVGILVAALGW